MANTIEFIIKATDQASQVVSQVEAKITTGAKGASEALSKLGKASEDSGSAAKQGAQGFESFAGKLVAIQSGIGIAKEAIAGLKQVWDFAKEGAENQRIAESFNRTAKQIGGSADDIIKKLDEAARGTVDDEELMQASTRALTLGVAKSGDDLVNVMKLARGAALQFGGDAGTAFENINQAIGNLAPRALKQYGIIVNLKDANDAYAKSLGISADALTEEQQRQALLNAVLAQGAKNFGDIGNAATTTGEKMKALETRFANIVDIAKEVAATGFSTAFDITDAPKNALEAFIGTAAKMKQEVEAGRMTVKDYNDGLRGMANNLTAVLPGAFADAAYNDYKLDAAIIALGKDSNEAARQTQYMAQAARDQAASTAQAATAASKHTQIMRDYSAQLLANVEAYQRTKINLADTTVLAIQYTESQKKQADVEKELDALNEKIASHGAARVVTVKNEKLSADELTKAQAQLAVAQEDLAGATKKEGETQAEFTLRVETLKGKVADYSQTLGEHTAVVGGATKAEQEQKKALEEQIAALQKTDEIDRAKGAFEALTQAFRDGTLTEGQYQERATALNAVTGLYTDAALKQATAQETLMKSFADPRSETWRGQLLLNQDAIDGLTGKTDTAIKSNDALNESLKNVGIIPPIEVKAKVTLDDSDLKKAHDVAGDLKFAKPPTITPKIDTTQATKDFDAFYTGKVGTIPAEKKTTAVLDKEAATKDVINLTNLYNTLPKTKSTTIDVDAKLAQQQLDDILNSLSSIVDKDVTVKVNYKVSGDRPEGFQRGIDMIVPPSPTGRTGDYFPFLAAPGERVTVQTPAQQAARQTAPTQSGDTYIYNTNVYNPLAAAMLADKQRRDRLARSNARMGVT